MTLLEIDLADGKLLIGPPTRFPAMLRVVSDAQRAHSALFTVWQQREHSGTIRRSWSELFPGAPLPVHSDSQLQQQLQAALRSGRLNAVFVRKPRRALNAVKPDQQRDRVMHVALTNKTVLLAPRGQLPKDLAKESSKTTRADALLRGIPPKHPLVNTIGQQASRVLPPALANGSRKELVQQLTRQLSSGQLEGAVLDQAEFVRRAASLPSAPKPVSRMSAKEKVYEALARSYDLCGGDLGAALKKLRDPHNLAMMVGFMLVLAGVQLIPGVDVVVDFGMLIWLLYTVGTKAVTGVKELVKAVSAAVDAKDDRQLDSSARHFADAFEALGEAGISALLAFLQGMRLAGRFAKAGEAEAEAAAGAKNSKPNVGERGASLPPEVQRMSKPFQQEYEAARAAGWKKPDGSPWYPPNNGGLGAPLRTTLDEGAALDRFGSEKGSFTSAAGEAFEKRALPGAPGELSQYEVTGRGAGKLIVEKSDIAPWFDQPGGGTQYRLINSDGTPMSVADAVQRGLLKRLP